MLGENSFIVSVISWIESHKATTGILISILLIAFGAVWNYFFPLLENHLVKREVTALFGIIYIGLFSLFVARAFDFHKKKLQASLLVYKPGSRYSSEVRDLINDILEPHEIHFGSVEFNNVLTVNDLIKVACRDAKPKANLTNISETVLAARRAACTHKYARHWDEDEKIQLRLKYGAWTEPLEALLKRKGVYTLENSEVIDVGFGNGLAYEVSNLFRTPKSFRAIDVSEKALEQAQLKFPNATIICDDAENLAHVPDEDVDIYFSLRTYQSSLFDQRAALHEAFRVLKATGLLIISIPRLYVVKNKEVEGLGDWKKRITKKYLDEVVSRIVSYAEMLGFIEIEIERESKYEIFIAARKPSDSAVCKLR